MVKLLFFLLIFFFTISHPFYCSIILLLISLSMLLLLNSIGNWMNYILCLIYLGGILILFIYISSILPNIKMKMKNLFIYMFISMPLNMYMMIDYSGSNYMLIFYNIFIFKYLLFFMFFMLLILLISSDFSKENISPMRLT